MTPAATPAPRRAAHPGGRGRAVALCLAVALALVAQLGATARADGAIREYWISAENMRWDLSPNGGDPLHRELVPEAERTFMAVVYRRYTRDFGRPFPNTREVGDNDGIPGPLIRAVVGDTVIVHFRNRDRHHGLPHSMHFHAFRYAPSSDGSFIPYRSGPGGNVPVGGRATYRLHAVEDSYGVWPYHDHSTTVTRSIQLGLYGASSIRRRGERRPDRELVVYLSEHLGFDTINGRAFIGNTPTLRGGWVSWCSGTCSASARTSTPSTSTGTAGAGGACRSTPSCSAPPARSGSAFARTRRARGSTTATSRATSTTA